MMTFQYDNLVDRIYQALEYDKGLSYSNHFNDIQVELRLDPPKQRDYLGVSQIGHPCARRIFLDYNGILPPDLTGQKILLFNVGYLEEVRMLALLKMLNFKLLYFSPRLKVKFDNGVKGTADCVANNEMLFEFKTMSDSAFKQLAKSNLFDAQEQYYMQMQLYMHGLNLSHGTIFVINKNTSALYAETIEYFPDIADDYLCRASKIISTRALPIGVDNKRYCNMCHFRISCQDNNFQERPAV